MYVDKSYVILLFTEMYFNLLPYIHKLMIPVVS
jgi:hypothetical protein